MNILIFSHSCNIGGAENALISMVSELGNEHTITISFPNTQGPLIDYFTSKNIKCVSLPMGFSLPNPHEALVKFSQVCNDNVIDQIRKLKFDMIICNTIVTLHGLLLAKILKIPSILYAHEKLEFDTDLAPHGCSSKFYLELVGMMSNHIICASEYIKKSFTPFNNKVSVLYPFTEYTQTIETPTINDALVSISVIGIKSVRKNTHFAITVLKALRLRGMNVELHLIGQNGSGMHLLEKKLTIRAEPNIYLHPNQSDPYTIGNGKKITLITAICEPFGLTMVESLFRGIPVVASKCGGPEEVLPKSYLYEVDDLDSCVRNIEEVVSNYKTHATMAKKTYKNFIKKHTKKERTKIISSAIHSANQDFSKNGNQSNSLNWEDFKILAEIPLSNEDIVKNIAEVTNSSTDIIKVQLTKERALPGVSVMNDMRKFDVVPFATSNNLNTLYKDGTGLSIQLLSYISDIGKVSMLSYILLALREKQQIKPIKKVLCLGDGMGIDSIRFAQCGYDVDYLDFDSSKMGQIAELNFKKIKESNPTLKLNIIKTPVQKYDAVISLEVIEHVDDPVDFLKFIHSMMSEDGFLFISECFDGIHDIWATHILKHEEFANLLPLLASPYFKLVDMNNNPFGKPYMFQKIDAVTPEVLSFLKNREWIINFINTKLKIGI
jgi:glycosyltransferase involved in cell wall biosynthesis/SAM-dependent methyltransferase